MEHLLFVGILHTLSDARLLATGGGGDRSTKRKTLLWKDNLNKMKVEPLFSLPKGVEVTSIEVTENGLIISAVSTQPSACCPLCSSAATRVHSHYTRTIADLPCAGQHVRLLLQVRKFFCEVSTCTQKIFAERLTPFVERMAHA